MKLKLFISLACPLLLLSACTHVFSPALYHQDVAYQPKPTSFDTVKQAGYASVAFNSYTNENLTDIVVSGQFNLSKGYVFKNFNLAYGVFGVLGDYQNGSNNPKEANYFSDRFFGAVGGRASANAFVNMGRVDFRFIGVEAAYSDEFGDYADFRHDLQKQPGNYVDGRTQLFTIGLTTEVIFHNRNSNDFQHGIRGFLGGTMGHNDLDQTYYKDETSIDRLFRNIFPKASYFIQYKDFFATIEAGNAIFLRVGYKF